MPRLLKIGNHTCLGSFQDGAEVDSPVVAGDTLDKRVLLCYPGLFASMDGPVEVTEDNITGLCSNYNSLMQRALRLATGEIHLKECAPVQTDHSASATNTVGRLTGPLETASIEIPDEGMKLGLFGTLRFIGHENCQRVRDGRWTHVSLGADLDTNKINEISITPFPAAAHAALLSRGVTMAEGEKKQYRDMTDAELELERANVTAIMTPILTQKGPDDEMCKMLQTQLDQMQAEFTRRGEEAAKLSAASDDKPKDGDKDEKDDKDDKAKLAEDEDEEKKEGDSKEESTEAVDPIEKKKAAELTATRKQSFIALAKGIKGTQASLKLEERKANISVRLSNLRMAAKITPAEQKKIDVVRLASSNDATIDAVLKSYEAREPVIMTGVFSDTRAPEIASLAKDAKKARLSKLEDEAREHMQSVKKTGSRSAKFTTQPDTTQTKQKDAALSEAAAHTGDIHLDLTDCIRLMEDGDYESALSKIRACAQYMAQVKMSGSEYTLSAMTSEIEKLRRQSSELMKLTAESLQVSESELGS